MTVVATIKIYNPPPKKIKLGMTNNVGLAFNIGDTIHSKLCSITHVVTKVHVTLRSFLVLTWIHDTIELV